MWLFVWDYIRQRLVFKQGVRCFLVFGPLLADIVFTRNYYTNMIYHLKDYEPNNNIIFLHY